MGCLEVVPTKALLDRAMSGTDRQMEKLDAFARHLEERQWLANPFRVTRSYVSLWCDRFWPDADDDDREYLLSNYQAGLIIQ